MAIRASCEGPGWASDWISTLAMVNRGATMAALEDTVLSRHCERKEVGDTCKIGRIQNYNVVRVEEC